MQYMIELCILSTSAMTRYSLASYGSWPSSFSMGTTSDVALLLPSVYHPLPRTMGSASWHLPCQQGTWQDGSGMSVTLMTREEQQQIITRNISLLPVFEPPRSRGSACTTIGIHEKT